MDVLIITSVVFVVAFCGMAVGVIFSNREIQGSCGGIGKLLGSSACDMCSHKKKCQSGEKENE
ncbi:MAG: (Na+)-NQR maturation NqrM [Halobacteriovoraceae bacterium]|jgi:uncharacterized protein|nr:(Na+)-NQR maturation NqrM [Halobacteriovoraceae bacterium]